MMKERNGIVFFDLNEDYSSHPAGKALKEVSLGDVKFPFGFFIVEEGGKKFVRPGTRDDHVQRLLKAFPDYPVELLSGVGRCQIDVFSSPRDCKGGCPDYPSVYWCVKMFDEGSLYFSCGCIDMS